MFTLNMPETVAAPANQEALKAAAERIAPLRTLVSVLGIILFECEPTISAEEAS